MITMIESLIYSGGGIVVGALGVIAYARATGQRLRPPWEFWQSHKAFRQRTH